MDKVHTRQDMNTPVTTEIHDTEPSNGSVQLIIITFIIAYNSLS